MTLDDTIVERIVRAVLDRLPSDELMMAGRTMEDVADERAQAERIVNRVVSLARVEQIAAGVSTIEIPPGTVVTPSAHDRLRERGISLRVIEAPEAKQKVVKILTAVADGSVAIDNMRRLLKRAGVELELLPSSGFADMIEELTREIRLSGRKGVLLTERTFSACCLANRHPRVRAAAVESVAQVRVACKEVVANLLALNPTGRSSYEMSAMLKAFSTFPASPDQKNIIEGLN